MSNNNKSVIPGDKAISSLQGINPLNLFSSHFSLSSPVIFLLVIQWRIGISRGSYFESKACRRSRRNCSFWLQLTKRVFRLRQSCQRRLAAYLASRVHARSKRVNDFRICRPRFPVSIGHECRMDFDFTASFTEIILCQRRRKRVPVDRTDFFRSLVIGKQDNDLPTVLQLHFVASSLTRKYFSNE